MKMLDKSVLESLGMKYPTFLPYGTDIRGLSFLNGFSFYHRNYYYVMQGKFPYTDARKLFDSGISKRLAIREAGMGNGIDPEKWITSDAYQAIIEKEVLEWWQADPKPKSHDEFEAEINDLKDKMMKEDISLWYLKEYHIDTDEGLMYMINYLKEKDIHSVWSFE